MIIETALMFGTYFLGLIYATFLPFSNKFLSTSTAFFWGIILICFTCFPLSLLYGLTSNLIIYIYISLVFIGITVFFSKKKYQDFTFSWFLISISLFFLVASVSLVLNLNFFSGDSFLLSREAFKLLSFKGNMQAHSLTAFSSWGAILLTIQYIGNIFGVYYFKSLNPILYLSVLSSFYLLLKEHLKFLGIQPSWIRKLFLFILASSPVFLKVMLLIQTNAFLISFLFLSVVFIWQGLHIENSSLILTGGVFLIACGLSRVEAPIYASLFLILFGLSHKFKLLPFKIVFFSFFATMALWYFILYFFSLGVDVLSKERAFFLGALFALIMFTFPIVQLKIFSNLREKSLLLTNCLFIGLLFLAFLYKPMHLLTSMRGLIINFMTLNWLGIVLIVVWSLLFLAKKSFYSNKDAEIPFEKIIGTGIFLCFLSVIIFCIFRSPFRHSVYDSASRILISFIPLFFYYVVLKLELIKHYAIDEVAD